MDRSSSPRVFFDFTCTYSARAHTWLRRADPEASWSPFLFKELHREEGPPIWDRPDATSSVSVLALCLHEAIVLAGGDTRGFRSETFDLFARRASIDDLWRLGERHNVSVGGGQLAAALRRVAEQFTEARQMGVFGTPTLALPGGALSFIKLAATPASDTEGRRLLDAVSTIAACHLEVVEIKRPEP